MDIKLWDIPNSSEQNMLIKKKINQLLNEDIFTGTKLLNLQNSKLDILEKYVYDISKIHAKRLNLSNEEYYVEFWIKNKFDTHILHVDCDEQKKEELIYKYPLLSCVTYLSESYIPTIITNIDVDRNMYKDFHNDINLYFSFPDINKHITFNPSFFHGTAIITDDCDLNNERTIVAINLWKTPPINIRYYTNENILERVFNSNQDIFIMNENNNSITEIPLPLSELNYDTMEDILYRKNINTFKKFNKWIEKSITGDNASCYKFILDKSLDSKEQTNKLIKKYGDIINDINYIRENDIKYNRFFQRFTYNRFYNSDICNWIIYESEKYASNNGGWTTKRHINYPTTDIPVHLINSISTFIFQSSINICNFIKESYQIPNEMGLDIQDLFIVKYEHDKQNFLEPHKDGSFISFNILLTNPNDFEGGGTEFEDGLITKNMQGDLFIHSSLITHSGIPITKGKRYLLVGFINLKLII